MPDAGRWLARDRGAFEVEVVARPELTVSRATAELQDFLSKDERDWMQDLFLRLAR